MNGWSPEQRQRQVLIQSWKPWERSTGPTTAEGKARAAQDAYKGGERQLMRVPDELLGSICCAA